MRELPTSTDVRMAAYRRLLPLVVLALMGSWAVHWVTGSTLVVDAWLLPSVALLMVASWALATQRVLSVPVVETVILLSLGGFFLVKMAYVAWFVVDPAWYDMAEFPLYLPGYFAMAYWSIPRRRAWGHSWVFLVVFLLVASPLIVRGLVAGTPDGIGTSLFFLHLVIMSALIIEFLRAYGDAVFAQRREVDQAERLASVDELTELTNRRGLERRLRQLSESFVRTGVPYSVVLVDLDRFKQVNDTYGHNVGDEVLRRLGRLLRQSVRGDDLVGRWGGEEFTVVCPATSVDAAAELAERLRVAIAATAFPHGIRLTSSFGVAEARSGDGIDDVVGRADAALYDAKRTGRARVSVDRSHALDRGPELTLA